ncbi:unnamed protein product [Musa hybrid cultivar]
MAATAFLPSLLLLLLLLPALISAIYPYDGSHALRRMTLRHPHRLPYRLASQSAHRSAHRRSPFPKRYVLAETKTTPALAPSNSSTNRSSSEHHHSRSHKQSARNWIVGFITGSLAGIGSGAVLSVLFRLVVNCIRGRYRNPGGPSIFSPKQIKRAEDLAFLEKDDGLAGLEVIGRGGCGEVYKAQLPPDPSKPDHPGMSRLLDKWMRQIRSEIHTVGHIRHRNLLPLLAHVTRPDCHLLIYEFMKNGSLDSVLNSARDGERELDWLARYRIALGIASGLEYLHIHHNPQIIHRDLKPANILLDDGMEARIADFGLAKEMPDAQTHITASKVAGTLGYISPEYGQTLRFTAKCDIYSFGVILAVLVVGKMPSDPFFHDTDEISLVRWLRKVMSSANPTAAIDPKLAGNEYEEQMLLVLRIAIFCTVDDPKERPSSKESKGMKRRYSERQSRNESLAIKKCSLFYFAFNERRLALSFMFQSMASSLSLLLHLSFHLVVSHRAAARFLMDRNITSHLEVAANNSAASSSDSDDKLRFQPLWVAVGFLMAALDDGCQIIGRGGCGVVYKAGLAAVDGRRVAAAIKKIIQPAVDAAQLCDGETKLLNYTMRQIRSEIQTVGRIRHPNLLPLLGHISRPSCHYLLEWPARYNIALGIAAGLEYLHVVHRPRVIHRDLKPANILLDDDLNARISDFGLAKVVPDTVSGPMRSGLKGTIGYIAPEYHQTLLFTDKCDMRMVDWVSNAMRSAEPEAAIDRTLVGNGFEEQMLLVLKIACFCTYDNPKARPNSREVRLMLAQIKH